jgi:MOSC domain-containing protein YiiM/GNAT superfamily N-acetyltransferase
VSDPGRVLQVNVTRSGVPRDPVAQARVTKLGLEGDRHKAPTVHGGPHRAVSLFGIEAIRRVAAEGHPIRPGSVGENLTTEGLELSLLPTGARLAVGEEVLLELSAPAMPCNLIEDSFRDRRSGRISILRFPSDSRMYARVLREGTVRPGDAIRVLPPADDSQALLHRQLDRFDAVEREAYLTMWQALAASGVPVSFLDDGELVGAATPSIPVTSFNRTFGLRLLPHLLDRILSLYLRANTTGWLVSDESPWRDAVPGTASAVLAAPAEGLATDAADRDDLTIREVGPADTRAFADISIEAYGMAGAEADAWRALTPHLARAHGEHLFVAEQRGRAVGAAALFLRRRTGLLAGGAVVESARGQGIQRALIAERIRRAAAAKADWLIVTAEPGGVSARNLEASGFEAIWDRRMWRFDPVADREGALAAADEAAS